MPTLLHIDSSPRLDGSVTRALTARFVRRWLEHEPAGRVIHRDVGLLPPPHPDAFTLAAARLGEAERNPRQQAAARLADALLNELVVADIVLVGAPVYNFSVTSGLKAWFDLVSRPGRTFRYGPDGPEGLLRGKRVVVLTARGGIAPERPKDDPADDPQALLIANFFRLAGLDDLCFIKAEGQDVSPQTAGYYRARAEQAIDRLALP